MSARENVLFADATEIQELYHSRQLSIPEFIELSLEQIKAHNQELCAFITVNEEQAVKDAEVAQQKLDRGEALSPLHGIPLGVKDNLLTKGLRTTAGSRLFREWIPAQDARVVEQLKQAGAILVGKTNLHEFAMGATTENPHFGNCRNPFDPERIAGGSSGGSAVAVASGMTVLALGTDTAGSIRLPAALCGIVGYKPSYDVVSRAGCLPFSWSNDHIGPMTRSVRDARLMLACLAESSKLHPQTISQPMIQEKSFQGLKVGICKEHFFEDIHLSILPLVEQTMSQLEQLGAEIVEITLDSIPEALLSLRKIMQAEGFDFHRPLLEKLRAEYEEDILFRLEYGRTVSAGEYLQAQRFRKKFMQHVLEQMASVDLLLSPMNHNLPFVIGSVTPEQAINNMFNLAKAPLVSFLAFPAVSLPCGLTEEGLPAGIQLIGKPYRDYDLLEMAERLETALALNNSLAKRLPFYN